MRYCTRFLFCLYIFQSSLWAQPATQLPGLARSDNNRHLVTEDGKVFFWLGDTAWELFHRLGREEADRYLEDRARKRFTVIQAVVLAELDGLRTPNRYGDLPLINEDPAKPNEAYFQHVDYIVEKANSLGMYIGMLPTWGDKFNKKWGEGPEVFTPENAALFGEYLGKRYKDSGIIWILGGDRNIDNEIHREIIRAMAEGLARGDGGEHLMTFHPQGSRNSAEWFHEDDWLDFNMVQSGHERPHKPNYKFNQENLALQPPKPTLDGEPCYEDHPVKGAVWEKRKEPGVLLPWFDEWNVRRNAYQSMLSGALGHTYGHHSIWQMWTPEKRPLSIARTPWQDALEHPGALQMKYFRGLFEARPFWKIRMDQSLVKSHNPEGDDHCLAGLATDRSFAVLYLPTGQPIEVDLSRLADKPLMAWWFNPRQNSSQLIGNPIPKPVWTFTPPTSGRNNDWILVIDVEEAFLTRLGTSFQHFTPVLRE